MLCRRMSSTTARGDDLPTGRQAGLTNASGDSDWRFTGGLQDVQVARGLCYIGVRRDTMSG